MGLASLIGAGYIIWVFWAFSCWISLIRGPRASLMISLMSCDPTGGIDIEKLDARRVGWLWLNKAESAFFLWVSRMRGRASRCQRDVTLDAVGKECVSSGSAHTGGHLARPLNFRDYLGRLPGATISKFRGQAPDREQRLSKF